jgi:L-threonylcarbamoyladenylate synthase
MKNSYSNIFAFNKKILNKTIKNLNNGNVAGLPTETVYGLAGNAYSKTSIQRIYKLKERPSSNPLIIHYHNFKDALNDIEINENFIKLYKFLCPGPVTFILKKKYNSKIHPLASAKLNTVAIRFPKHKIIRAILKEIDFPLAMPSANKSTNVSPVKAKDVFDEFKKKIQLIIDGGKCKIGIESTVIDLTGLKKKIKNNIKGKKTKSPGMMKKHYSPGIPVFVNQKKYDGKSAFIYLGNKYKNRKNFFSLSKNLDLNEAASNLYEIFRLIKIKGYKRIQISKIPNFGSGIAINDRIQRASKS